MPFNEPTSRAPTVLTYDRPAERWLEALPLGNGFTGAMVYGGIAHEIVSLNDSTAWSGGPASESRPPVVPADRARDALRDSRTALARCDYAGSDKALQRIQHRHSQAFLPLADMHLELSRADGVPWTNERYQRWLDLSSALAGIKHEQDGMCVRREVFASHPGHVLVYRVRADGQLNAQLRLTSQLRVLCTLVGLDSLAILLRGPSDVAPPHERTDRPIEWDDAPQSCVRAAVFCRVCHDGVATPTGDALVISGATRCDVILATATTFTRIGEPLDGDEYTARDKAARWCERALDAGVDTVRAAHLADYRPLFDRVTWELTQNTASELTTDRMVTTAADDPRGPLRAEPALAPMLFNMGRYLLVASSRDGGVPANLQGIWNDDLRPSWSSNYTININTQMNYWAADVTDLPETIGPLVSLIEALATHGRETAARLYASKGWAAHHNTDIWAYTEPVGNGVDQPKWAYFPLAGVWLARHLISHLEFGARSVADSQTFAAHTVWPVIASAVEFATSLLVEVDGTLGTCPSTSPENDFWAPDGQVGGSARSSTIDLVLIRELLSDFTALAEHLGRDDEIVRQASAALLRLGHPQINDRGRVTEWWDDFTSTDPHHRHQSHLYGVFPGKEHDPGFLRAASASLDDRGDDSTGWSLVWRIALRARLGEPEAAERLISLLLRNADDSTEGFHGGLFPNLFAAHPPFQIDANLGFPAALSECLLRDIDGITILPALPPGLAPARVSGLVARPGVKVDVEWATGTNGHDRLVSTRLEAITSAARRAVNVHYGDRSLNVDLATGPVTLNTTDFRSFG